MADLSTVDEAVQDLRSGEQVELLNAIDKLRRENINADISVPQIVVCGDQSSGKSSVLEAIAKVRFPRGSRTTTRFPIEVVLRNAAKESTKVRLHPSPERRDPAQQDQIRSFKPEADASDQDQFETVVQQAKDHLESVERDGEFWGDRLIAEISGPTQPHLTLVDLPGLIHNAAPNSKANHPQTIKKMTKDYLDNPRSVVLAVVNALNDQANQQILSLVESSGNARSRTMGIITKPDIVPKDSHDESAVVEMARNNDFHLGHGWHVLKNVGHHETPAVRDKRDQLESSFFSTGIWSTVDEENVGISNLRKKLSRSLLSSIKRDLPKLVEEMQDKLSRCTKSLDQLGEGRESPGQQRGYLSKVLSRLKTLVESGLEGQYPKVDSDFFDGAEEKQLRDAINGVLRGFAKTLRNEGKTFLIYNALVDRNNDFPELAFGQKPSFSRSVVAEAQQPHTISLKRYCKALSAYMSGRQGKHLRVHSSEIASDIFRQQSVFWERITTEHVDRCCSQALDFMELAIMHAAGEHTGDKIFQLYVEPAFEKKAEKLAEKVSDLLWPFLKSHPITYNPSFAYQISNANGDRYVEKVESSDWKNPDLVLAAEAMDQAETYYEISMNRYIDEIATLAIERWLLDDLPSLIPPEVAWTLSNEELEKIAAEPSESRERRRKLTLQVGALQDAMRVCRRHIRHRSPGERTSDAAGIETNESTNMLPSSSQQKPSGKGKADMTSSGTATNGLFSGFHSEHSTLFGANATSRPSSSLFGGGLDSSIKNPAGSAYKTFGSRDASERTTPRHSNGGGLFGGSTPTSSSGSIFGNPSNTTGAPTFGHPTLRASSSPFGTNLARKDEESSPSNGKPKGSGGWHYSIVKTNEEFGREDIMQSITAAPGYTDHSFEVSTVPSAPTMSTLVGLNADIALGDSP